MSSQVKPWYVPQLLALKQAPELLIPEQQRKVALYTADYEQSIRELWEASKPKLTTGIMTPEEFADEMEALANDVWPEAIADILGIDVEDLTDKQREMIDEAVSSNSSFLHDSLAPDIARAIEAGASDISSFDFRTIFMYAGALWSLGSLATVMFDGISIRDLTDLFIFFGPNDEATCTGERGCAQFANGVYTVAQILAEDIIPGHLACYHNCRHFILPIASPLREKHLAGCHDQRRTLRSENEHPKL